MDVLNIPFKFGNTNKKITLDHNNLDNFLFFIGKIDFLCNTQYIILKNENNKLTYNIVNILKYKVSTYESNDDIYSNVIITNVIEDYNSKPIVIYLISDTIEINFNFNITDQYIINRLMTSFDIFNKTFDGKNYSLVENEEKFIQDYNLNKDYNINNTSLISLLKTSVSKNKNNIAIKFKNTNITYQELLIRIKKISSLILKQVNPGSSISILLDKSENIIIVIWAILYSGCCYVPIDINDPIERIKFIINNSNSNLLITDQQDFQIDINKININSINYTDLTENENHIDENEDLAYILHTSGTTGQPKGVKISRKGLINYSLYQIETLKWKSNDKIIQKTPYIWDVSLREVVVPLISGSTIIITESEKHKDPEYILNLIKKEKATFVHFVPSMLSIFLEFVENNKSLNSINNVVCSGEALPDRLRIKFYKYFLNAILYNMYGPTEATVEVTNYTCPKIDIDLKMHIGKTVPNTPLLILNRDGIILPKGITGELHIGGPQVSLGYINQDKLTASTFVKTKYINGNLYKTGDLSKLLEDKNIEYLGRIDSQIKIRGMRIEISEIKKNILKYSGVSDCHVTLYKYNNKYYLIAYLSPRDIDISKLINHISKFLPKQMIPDKFIKLNEFPISKNGKLDKKGLPEPKFTNNITKENLQINKVELKETIKEFFINNNLLEHTGLELYNLIIQRNNNIEEDYLEIFSELLNIPISDIDLNLNLEYLGIDSIKMMKLQSLLKKRNYTLTISELEQYKTIKKIYDFLETKDKTEDIFDVEYYFNKIDSIVEESDDYLCIHSSLPNLNLNLLDLKDLIYRLINKWTSQNKTVLIPSFTIHSFPKYKKYCKSEYLNETGILAEIVYQMGGSSRTDCPFYSFVVIGKNKDLFLNQLPESSLGNKSIFEYCEKLNIKIIGLGTNAMTQFHRYEEVYQVPYRYFKSFEGIYLDNSNNKTDIKQKHFVRYLDLEVENLLDCDILDILGKKLIKVKLGETFIRYIKTNTMKDLFQLSFRDPFILLKNKKSVIEYCIKNKNYNFKKFEVDSSPIMKHFLEDREITNISSEFYQYIVLSIKKNISIEKLFFKIEDILFNFSPLFYYLNNNKFYLDYNLRKNIKDKFKRIEKDTGLLNIINNFAKELNINIGDNFRVIFIEETNNLIFVINHFFVDGISWRLLMDNLSKLLNNEEIDEEKNRFDIWSNQLSKVDVDDNEFNYWNNTHQSIEKFFDSKEESYSNKFSKVKKFKIKISNKKQHMNIRNYTLNKLLDTLFDKYNKKSISLNIETHGREDITFINDMNSLFGWYTSYFPMTFEKTKYRISDIEDKFKELNKNGIYYLLLKYNFIKKYSLTKEKNKIDILFNFMGDFSFESESIKLQDIGEEGDCGHVLSFWFDIASNNKNGCILNCNLYYLENHIKKEEIDIITNLLVNNFLI
jgi:amino acid adenylation domain-containing protein